MDLAARVAELEAALAERDALIVELRKTIARLEARLGQNSSNSGKPPSSDAPSTRDKRKQKTRKAKRKRGGQPGHPGHSRARVPPEKVDEVHDVYPSNCADCGVFLPKTAEDDPVWHQVMEIPPIEPHTTEYRLHAVVCRCGACTRAELPEGVSPSPFGPRLTGIVGLLTGVHSVPRRAAQSLVSELFGVEMSLGAVSNCERRLSDALATAVEDAFAHVLNAAVKHADATSWYLNNRLCQLWTIATSLVTVFAITFDGTKETVKKMLGEARGILVTDRAGAFKFWAMANRQVCWAHLLRKFVSFAEKDDPVAAKLGDDLVKATRAVFRWWWKMQSGQIDRAALVQGVARYRRAIERLLAEGEACDTFGIPGSCRDINAHAQALWTFLHVEGVEPTNNHAERELRRLVQWRKNCFGSQSHRGLDFVVRIATVARTIAAQTRAGQRDGSVLDYLHQACSNSQLGRPADSLIPPQTVDHAA